MSSIEPMLQTHPEARGAADAALVACVQACYGCAATCTICADACLAEEQVDTLRRCIRLNLDCADICRATGAVASRLSRTARGVLRAQLQACLEVCRACGDECASHAHHHEHCGVCAEACRACAEACERLLGSLPG